MQQRQVLEGDRQLRMAAGFILFLRMFFGTKRTDIIEMPEE